MRELAKSIITTLQSATALEVGEILHAKGKASSLQSARVLAQRHLNTLVDLGQVERLGKVYRIKGSQSEHKDHSQLINKHLIPFISLPIEVTVHKEHSVNPVKIRSDAVVLLKHKNKYRCAIIEVCATETIPYIESKKNIWAGWPDSKDYLSRLFKLRIPYFDFVVSGEHLPKGAVSYNQFLKEVQNEVM